MSTTHRRVNPWLVLIIIHATGLTITAALFAIAAIVDGAGGQAAHEAGTALVMSGVVLAPLVTIVTALWWYWAGEREALPAKPEPKPYDGMPATVSSLQRTPA